MLWSHDHQVLPFSPAASLFPTRWIAVHCQPETSFSVASFLDSSSFRWDWMKRKCSWNRIHQLGCDRDIPNTSNQLNGVVKQSLSHDRLWRQVLHQNILLILKPLSAAAGPWNLTNIMREIKLMALHGSYVIWKRSVRLPESKKTIICAEVNYSEGKNADVSRPCALSQHALSNHVNDNFDIFDFHLEIVSKCHSPVETRLAEVRAITNQRPQINRKREKA